MPKPPSSMVVEGDTLHRGTGVVGTGPVALPADEGALAFDDRWLSRHLLFLGAIGSGKTHAIYHVVSGLLATMTPSDVLVLFDTKGDYQALFARPGDVVVGWEDDAVRWNLFREAAADPAARHEETFYEIARTLFVDRIARSQQPFFPQAACDVCAALMIALWRQHGPQATNADLRACFDQATLGDWRQLLEPHPDLRGVWQYLSNEKSAQTQGVLSEAQQAMREVLVGPFRQAGTFSMREAVRAKGGRTIFVEYDIAAGRLLEPVYRLLIDLALKEALSRHRPEGRVFVVLDEFALLPRLQHLEQALNFGRSLGVRCIVGAQNVGQVSSGYGTDGAAASILAGFGTVVAFRLFDAASRDFVRQRHGRNRRRLAVPSVIGARGVLEEIIEGSVIEDWDLSGLAVGQAVVSPPTGPPQWWQFRPYPTAP